MHTVLLIDSTAFPSYGRMNSISINVCCFYLSSELHQHTVVIIDIYLIDCTIFSTQESIISEKIDSIQNFCMKISCML